MKRLAAWAMALISLVTLLASIILILANQAGWDVRAWEYLSGAVVGLAAPVLGVVILRKQPHNRIGWLWLVIGLAISFISLGQGLKYLENATLSGEYTTLVFTLLLFSDTVYIVRFICMMLMMLWFPDGSPPTPRWRILHPWTALSFIFLLIGIFAQQVPWTPVDGNTPGNPLVDNPIGFIPVRFSPIYDGLAPLGFFSIIGMSLLAVLAMLLRYRSAGPQVRAQIRWFIVGGIFYAASFITLIFLLELVDPWLPGILMNLAVLPFYLAIGFAITRYRLYDIDVIIRKTLQYALVTGGLALVYFGSVVLLQSLTENIFGEQSPLVIVLSTLGIAALFNPLRNRVQDFIDRRFYRNKYDAEKALAQFSAATRDEVELDSLAASMLRVIEGTMQPEKVSLWINRKVQSQSKSKKTSSLQRGTQR